MADPEQYRTKEEVARRRERDPLSVYGALLVQEGTITEAEIEQLDAEALRRVDAAVAFAEASPFPEPASLYDDIYVLGEQPRGVYSVETTEDRAEAAPGGSEPATGNDEIPGS
jgi:pyruvate dehydrogenase E1 component alpha subunit